MPIALSLNARLLLRLSVFGVILAVFTLLTNSTGLVQADHLPSEPEVHVYTANFATSGQSQIQPGPVSGNDVTFGWDFVHEWDTSDSDEEIETVHVDVPGAITTAFGIDDFDADFGGGISGGTNGKFGLGMSVDANKNSDLAIDYPVDITLTTPCSGIVPPRLHHHHRL